MADKKTVIVTGGAGLIGSYLIELLLAKGYRVVSLDNYFIGTESNHIKGAEYHKGHTKDIEAILGDENPEIIFHLGEYSRIRQSFAEPAFVWDLNVAGTFAVLEYWRKRKCRLQYAASSTKFAIGDVGRDASPYAWMKASNTDLVTNYGKWYDLPYTITYFYNNYGRRELSEGPYASVIGNFKTKFLAGEPLPVIAPGTQRRNFTFAGDTARGLIEAGERGQGDGYGFASKESFSILELAQMFGDKIEMLPEVPGDRKATTVETEKAEKEFGWKAERHLKDYIEDIKAGRDLSKW
ncbi:NAD-dependent epimerase/dehydratase family protein [Candidatus Kaiserbacteria bacterium]|nr:NAD-dependent epimerase/dehydratase family protein [Candidatus Kaiserbacteria bacterium]